MVAIRVLLATGMIALSGCGNFFDSKTEVSSTTGALGAEGIDFSLIRARILEPHCTRCHASYQNYQVVRQDLGAMLNAIEVGRMPKGSAPLSESLLGLLRTWQAQGAPERLSAVAPPAESLKLEPNWNSLFVHVFGPRCSICHSASGQAPWVDLSDRATMAKTLIKHINFTEPEKSPLVLRLRDKDEPMPPYPPDSNLPQLSEEEVDVVLDWIRAGLP